MIVTTAIHISAYLVLLVGFHQDVDRGHTLPHVDDLTSAPAVAASRNVFYLRTLLSSGRQLNHVCPIADDRSVFDFFHSENVRKGVVEDLEYLLVALRRIRLRNLPFPVDQLLGWRVSVFSSGGSHHDESSEASDLNTRDGNRPKPISGASHINMYPTTSLSSA